LLLSICWVACARPTGNEESGTQVSQPVPFRDAGSTTLSSTQEGSLAVPEPGVNPATGVPFHDSENLPAGTLLTVRLKNQISSDVLTPGSIFTAVVDDPVVIDGKTLVPRGAMVIGRIESARSSGEKQGYVRLALNSLDFGGRDLTVNTSSLFARGKTGASLASGNNGPTVVHLEPGRRLTFRLTEPVYVASQMASSRH
jgi:hypothetical protein